MILEYLLIGATILIIVDLIGIAIGGYYFYQEIMPWIRYKKREPNLVKEKEEEWIKRMNHAFNEVIEEYPNSNGVKKIIKLFKQKLKE